MSAEEMASRELKEWRQAELKHDIEKIKSHELEMISLGSVYVMKSHKGEQVRATPKVFLKIGLAPGTAFIEFRYIMPHLFTGDNTVRHLPHD